MQTEMRQIHTIEDALAWGEDWMREARAQETRALEEELRAATLERELYRQIEKYALK